MRIKTNEYNYNRLAHKYDLDIYEDRNGYNVFSNRNNEILMEGLPTENSAIEETIKVFNENINKKLYRHIKRTEDLFRY